jgi:glycosyltransferase involved in cell wall biosynthesis
MMPDHDSIKISVVIPTYNRIALIGRAIKSILSQKTTGGVEIIVVDDGSTDNTVAYIESTFSEVIMISQTNSGPSAARNKGILAASGKYIAFLDSDDELVGDSLSSRALALDMNTDVDLVCGDFINCRDNQQRGPTNFERLNILTTTRNRTVHAATIILEDFFERQLQRPQYITSALMVRRSAISDLDLFNPAITIGEDWEFCLRFSQNHTVAILMQTVAKRHVHGSNLARDERSPKEAVGVDRVVLSYSGLTDQQHAVVKRRLAEDLFEYAYARFWDSPFTKEYFALAESMRLQMKLSKLKLLIAYCLPRRVAEQLQKSDSHYGCGQPKG